MPLLRLLVVLSFCCYYYISYSFRFRFVFDSFSNPLLCYIEPLLFLASTKRFNTQKAFSSSIWCIRSLLLFFGYIDNAVEYVKNGKNSLSLKSTHTTLLDDFHRYSDCVADGGKQLRSSHLRNRWRAQTKTPEHARSVNSLCFFRFYYFHLSSTRLSMSAKLLFVLCVGLCYSVHTSRLFFSSAFGTFCTYVFAVSCSMCSLVCVCVCAWVWVLSKFVNALAHRQEAWVYNMRCF